MTELRAPEPDRRPIVDRCEHKEEPMGTMPEFRHERGTILANEDGQPVAVVLGHDRHERDLTIDPMVFLSEAARLTNVEWDHVEGVTHRLTGWIWSRASLSLWRYATEDDRETYGAEDETWCAPGFHGAEVWVIAWDPDDASGAAEEFGIAANVDDD